MATCYRHPGRETGVSCSNCGNPICTDCMTATPVGMRCPDCAKQKTQVRVGAAAFAGGDPIATYVIMGICVAVFFLGGGNGAVFQDGALYGPAVDLGHDYWRLVTYGFLHGGIIHIAFNMILLFQLGTMLEPMLGRARFLGLYAAGLLGGACGALLLTPDQPTVGASGAVFGLMGAVFLMQRARGIDPMQSGIGPLILLNLAIGFIPGLNISIGGHIGGLVAGIAAAAVIEGVAQRRGPQIAAVLGCAAIGVVAVVGALFAATAPFAS